MITPGRSVPRVGAARGPAVLEGVTLGPHTTDSSFNLSGGPREAGWTFLKPTARGASGADAAPAVSRSGGVTRGRRAGPPGGGGVGGAACGAHAAPAGDGGGDVRIGQAGPSETGRSTAGEGPCGTTGEHVARRAAGARAGPERVAVFALTESGSRSVVTAMLSWATAMCFGWECTMASVRLVEGAVSSSRCPSAAWGYSGTGKPPRSVSVVPEGWAGGEPSAGVPPDREDVPGWLA